MPELQQNLTEYNGRLSTILDHPIDVLPRQNRSMKQKALGLETAQAQADVKIKLNEFYNLPDCGIKPIIAERNTSLGKLQSPSQRYLYEVRLLSMLTQCRLNASPEQSANLHNIITQKQDMLLHAWRNLLLNSREIQAAIFNPAVNTNVKFSHDFAITQWQQLLEFAPAKVLQSQPSHFDDLESILKHINEDQTPTRIWNDMALLSHQLPQITTWLLTSTESLTCQKAADKTKVEYLRNVFNLFFIQKIQTQASKLSSWHYKLRPILIDLYVKPFIPVTMQHYINSYSESQFNQFKTAIRDHVALWQDLFNRCKMAPVS